MKKKIIATILIFILLGITQYVTAQNDIQKEIDDPEPQAEYIDYFDWGIITGTYEIKKYNNKDQLVLKNEDYNETLRVTGLAWTYEYGEIPVRTFASVKTYKVIIGEFFGYCSNGRVFGIGFKNIDYGL